MAANNQIILNVPQDCDNAPKRRVIRDFIVFLYNKEWGKVNEVLDDNFEFKVIGSRSIVTIEDLKNYLDSDNSITELTLDQIITHGKQAACYGIVKRKNEEINFACFFEFRSAGKSSIKTISEYRVPVK